MADEPGHCGGCHAPASVEGTPHEPPHVGRHHASGWADAARVSLHCLTGCALGEWAGLSLGLLLGLATHERIVLAVALAYVSGFALTLVPLLRAGNRLLAALRIVWIGEAVSIAAMELAMNLVDYQLGGMRRGMSLLQAQYWIAFIAAAAAGFLAAWPVNRWLLGSGVKAHCH